MIGLVIVTHGQLAVEFIAVMEHVVGKQEQIAAVCMGPEDDMEQKRQEIIQKIKEVNTGKGVIVLTDMFGGTPSNLAISATSRSTNRLPPPRLRARARVRSLDMKCFIAPSR